MSSTAGSLAALLATIPPYASSTSLLALAVFFMNFTTILLSLRFFTTRMARQSFGLDDLTLGLSWVLGIAMDINIIVAVAYGLMGRILPPPVDIAGRIDPGFGFSASWSAQTKFYYAQQVMLPLQLTFAKLAIVFLYRRALVVGQRGFTHWATLATAVLIGLWGIAFFFTAVFQCGTLFSAIWDGPLALSAEKCVSGYSDVFFAAMDVLFDLIIIALPLHRIFTLQMSFAKKIQVTCAFMVGVVSLVGAVVRLAAYGSLIAGTRNSFVSLETYPPILNTIFMFWGTFEAGFAVTAATLPGLRPLLNKMASGVGRTWSSMREKSFRSQSTESYDGSDAGSLRKIIVHKNFEVHVSSEPF